MAALSFADALKLIKNPGGMAAADTQDVLSLLVAATLEENEGAELLKAWSTRGETGVELAATVRFLRERAVRVPVEQPCFDLCGTGGSGLNRYNVSTTVAFIAAAAGIPVAKHGNRGSRGPNGSFDLLEELGVPFDLTAEQEARLQKETNLCFIFARTHHPAVGNVVPYRKAAGCRTIFNLAGPLSNPAPIKHQIIGTVGEDAARVVAGALAELEVDGALVVWGHPGIDEISVTGSTGVLHVRGTETSRSIWDIPTHPDLSYETLPAGDAKENASTFTKLLSGKEAGPLLDMVCENAGAAVDLWEGRTPAYGGEGARLARRLVSDGQALATFEKHRAAAQALKS